MNPSDKEILNAMRTGCHTAPELVRRLYGLDGKGTTREYMYYRSRRSWMNRKLNSLTRYDMVRKTGMEKTGNTWTTTFEVVE